MRLIEFYQRHKSPSEQGILNYIADLAASTGTDIREWNIAEVFGSSAPTPMGLIQDNREINKRFFAKSKDVPRPEISLLSGDQLASISSFKEHLKKYADNVSNGRITDFLHRIQLLQNDIQSEQKRIKDEMDRKAATTSKLEEQIAAALQNTFYSFSQVLVSDNASASRVEFITEPVILSEYTGQDKLRLPMGRYCVQYFPLTSNLLLKTFRENVMSGRYYHPYVNENGQICWGTGQTTASKLLAAGDLKSALNLLQVLLQNYSQDTTPHRALGSFVESGTINGVPWMKYHEGKVNGDGQEEKQEKTLQQIHDAGDCEGDSTCPYCERDEFIDGSEADDESA